MTAEQWFRVLLVAASRLPEAIAILVVFSQLGPRVKKLEARADKTEAHNAAQDERLSVLESNPVRR